MRCTSSVCAGVCDGIRTIDAFSLRRRRNCPIRLCSRRSTISRRFPRTDEDIDAHDPPAAVRALRDMIATASGVVIATPEYNASVPGLLKNAIDWASRPYPDHALRGKPVIVVGASTTAFGAVLAQAELRRVLKAIGAEVLDVELPVSQAHEAFAQDGRLANPRLQSRLATHGIAPCQRHGR